MAGTMHHKQRSQISVLISEAQVLLNAAAAAVAEGDAPKARLHLFDARTEIGRADIRLVPFALPPSRA